MASRCFSKLFDCDNKYAACEPTGSRGGVNPKEIQQAGGQSHIFTYAAYFTEFCTQTIPSRSKGAVAFFRYSLKAE